MGDPSRDQCGRRQMACNRRALHCGRSAVGAGPVVLSDSDANRRRLPDVVRQLLGRPTEHDGPGLRRQPGWDEVVQTSGQPGLPARPQASLGVELRDQPVDHAPAGRLLSDLVRQPQEAPVRQQILRPGDGRMERGRPFAEPSQKQRGCAAGRSDGSRIVHAMEGGDPRPAAEDAGHSDHAGSARTREAGRVRMGRDCR